MGFLGFVTSGLSNLQMGISFVFQGSCHFHCLKILKLISFFCLFAVTMARGQEETSSFLDGRKRGTPREMLTTSSLVTAMFIEELRSFSKVPTNISLELSDCAAAGGRGGNNVVYFTLEQAELCFPILSLVKKFLHFTKALPMLIHPNVFHILMGYSVLNLLYQLDISLIDIFFIYTLKLRVGGRLSMSVHSP